MLVIDAVKRRERRSPPSAVDSIVWISALLFTVYAFWPVPFLIRAYRHGFDRADILLVAWAVIVIAVWFDVALVVDAVNMWRKPAQN